MCDFGTQESYIQRSRRIDYAKQPLDFLLQSKRSREGGAKNAMGIKGYFCTYPKITKKLPKAHKEYKW